MDKLLTRFSRKQQEDKIKIWVRKDTEQQKALKYKRSLETVITNYVLTY